MSKILVEESSEFVAFLNRDGRCWAFHLTKTYSAAKHQSETGWKLGKVKVRYGTPFIFFEGLTYDL